MKVLLVEGSTSVCGRLNIPEVSQVEKEGGGGLLKNSKTKYLAAARVSNPATNAGQPERPCGFLYLVIVYCAVRIAGRRVNYC